MLPAYVLKVDVIAKDTTLTEKQFREQVAPSLIHLDELKGAFDRKPSTIVYYPPGVLRGTHESRSARGIVMLSLGRDRAEFLIRLYQAIAHLIELELPDYEVRAEVSKFEFS